MYFTYLSEACTFACFQFDTFNAIPTLLAAGFVVGAAYGAIIFCASRIRAVTSKGQGLSKQRRELQAQLNKSLAYSETYCTNAKSAKIQ